jgi:hypothetical protein
MQLKDLEDVLEEMEKEVDKYWEDYERQRIEEAYWDNIAEETKRESENTENYKLGSLADLI